MIRQGWATSDVVDRVRVGRDEIENRAELECDRIRHEMKLMELNPFFSMLFKPRSTLSKIYELNYPVYWPVILIVLASGLGRLSMVIAAGGGVPGFIQEFLVSLFTTSLALIFTHFITKLFSGSGSFIRSVVAWGWSSVPIVLSGIVSLVVFLMTGEDWIDIRAQVGGAVVAPEHQLLVSIALVMFSMMSAWTFLLTVISVSEAQKVSKWRACAALLLGFGSLYAGVIALSS